MSLYTVQSAIYRMKKDKPFAAGFKQDPAAALAPLEMSPEERAALSSGDLAALYAMGVHPLLLAPYARLMEIPRPRYQALLAPLQGLKKMRS